MNARLCLVAALAGACAPVAALAGLGDPSIVADAPSAGALALVAGGAAAPILVSAGDWKGVARAAGDLRADVARVTGLTPELGPDAGATGAAVIIGTLGRSALIDSLAASGKIDAAAIRGRWEAFLLQVVDHPLPGVERALVIAGSDKRGTIYGTYELSEQIGVSPWYWWADVPVRRRSSLYIPPLRRADPGPAVRYRGIFLNDEAPALAGWAKEKFGGFNHRFYGRLFELMLRLRANYLWPAMWDNAFNEDDPEDPRLADEYGIVMGTSHLEPMLLAQQEWKRHGTGPWNFQSNAPELEKFWAEGVRRNRSYESIVTIGMRGDGDMPMSRESNIALLERIVSAQRGILARDVNPDVAKVPQLWALYKEVQDYFEKGMRVPDDVTLLWCDDNWGNLRRLPTEQERARPGGAGVYYHFDYVGGPRSYKWLNTYSITKVWEQMHLAWGLGDDRIWIVNVGDLKPMEFPTEFFLRYAWAPARWPYESLGDYGRLWAAREFGEKNAGEIASIMAAYTKFNARRKPEHVTPGTFSLANYGEADRVVAGWQSLLGRAKRVEASLPPEARDAFYQLVLFPVRASGLVTEINVAAARNQLYAVQGRASTNLWDERVRSLFDEDARLTSDWNTSFAAGKWRHMMDQTHLGYTTWQQPVRNAMPAVTRLQLPEEPSLGVAIDGSPDAWPTDDVSIPPPALPGLSPYGPRQTHIEVFSRGKAAVPFAVAASVPWLHASPASGIAAGDQRIGVTADWALVPAGKTRASITVSSPASAAVTISLDVSRPAVTGAGPVESDGFVSIDAMRYSRAVAGPGIEWRPLADFGPGAGAVEAFPVTAPGETASGASSRLEYDFNLVDGGRAAVNVYVAPTLSFMPGHGLRFALSVDGGAPQVNEYLPQVGGGGEWPDSVLDGTRRAAFQLPGLAAGHHLLKLWRMDPGVAFERIEVDLGGLRPSYLGPPASGSAAQP